MSDAVTIYFDGACEPTNPGGYMVWAFTIDRVGTGEEITDVGMTDPAPANTNNVAEWLALHNAVQCLSVHPYLSDADILIRGDSKLVINQLCGSWACRNERLAKARDKILAMLEGRGWRAEWIPREQNERADALGRDAYFRATGTQMPDRSKWKRSA